MPDYGFSVNMDGDVLAKMEKVEKALTRLANATDKNVDKINDKLGEMSDGLKKVGEAITAAFAVERIIEFGKEILHTTAEFEGFTNVIKYSSLNAYDAGQNLEYITQAATRLHLPLREAVEGFSEMQAGLIGTGIEGERLRNLFEGISTASTVLHLSSYNLQRTLYDFKEIGEIGLNQRIMRSLSTALPGINEIVRETFHKSFKQLEDEHFNGGQFLAGLSEGLRKHFAAGLQNAGNSLIALMNDLSTAWTRLKLRLGEDLRPVFVNLMTTMKEAFNSAPVQYFIDHIASLVQILGRLIPIWVIYKTTMYSIEGITRLAAKAQMLWAAAAGKSTIAIGETTVAVEGFEGALMATGVGAFAVALGTIIEGLISMNDRLDETVDKIAHLKEATDALNSLNDTFDRIEYSYRSQDKMAPKERSELLGDMQTTIGKYNDDIKKWTLSLGMTQEKIGVGAPTQMKGESGVEFAARQQDYWETQSRLKDAVKDLTAKLATADTKKGQLEFQARMLGALGVKVEPPGGFPNNGGMSNNALHTSDLAGIKGGLNEAKMITIHFHDALQKVVVADGKGVVAAGQSAIEVIIRTLNNLAYGQSRTM